MLPFARENGENCFPSLYREVTLVVGDFVPRLITSINFIVHRACIIV